MEYDDFSISFSATGSGNFKVSARHSDGSEEKGTFLLPPSLQVFLEAGQRLTGASAETTRGAHETPEKPPASAREVGSLLFETLFSTDIEDLFKQSLQPVRQKTRGLRIKLTFDLEEAEERMLARLPWETLYWQKEGRFLCQDKLTPVIRAISGNVADTQINPVAPLKILVVVANPEASDAFLISQLDVDAELRVFEELNQSSEFDVTIRKNTTREILVEELRKGEFHALHYIGHGDFRENEGFLLLEDAQGKVDARDSKDIEMIISNTNIPLVFLNACETAEGSDEGGGNPYAGIAAALARRGIPAVVAMQEPISNDVAGNFCKSFYSQVAKGEPLEVALTWGRIDIWPSNEGTIPVLFSRAKEDLRLIEPQINAGGGNVPVQPKSGPAVYLARVASDMENAYQDLVSDLRDHGFRVLPEDDLPVTDEAAFTGEIESLFSECKVSIHLIGENHGGMPDGFNDSIVGWQYELAVQEADKGNLIPVTWVPRDANPKNKAHKLFLQSVRAPDHEIVGKYTVIGSDIETLKTRVHEAIDVSREEEKEVVPAGDRKQVYLIHDKSDKTAAEDLWTRLMQFAEVSTPIFEQVEGIDSDDFDKMTLEGSDALMFFWGEAGESWLKIRQMKIKQFLKSKKLKCSQFLYLTDPVGPPKKKYLDAKLDYLIDGTNGVDNKILQELVEGIN